MIRVAVVGLGKMGLSHLSILREHPRVTVEALCDSMGYVLGVLKRYTGVSTYTDVAEMFRDTALDAVIIATPSKTHGELVEAALQRGLHVFCEKPFCLSSQTGEALARLATDKGLVNQVGYHYRFVGAFQEVKRLLDARAIGDVTHATAEAYGPVVLRAKGPTWRTHRSEGGGCLYDYASHAMNLLTWYFGTPEGIGGAIMKSVFSTETDDAAYGTLYFADGVSAQLSANWSDESYRKMSVKIAIWGTNGRIVADRQECQVYLRAGRDHPIGYHEGWNLRNAAELTNPVWFYVRGEEYSAQVDYFVDRIEAHRVEGNVNSFANSVVTDRMIEMLVDCAQKGPSVSLADDRRDEQAKRKRFRFGLS
jgi:predicted dehydrogenase